MTIMVMGMGMAMDLMLRGRKWRINDGIMNEQLTKLIAAELYGLNYYMIGKITIRAANYPPVAFIRREK
jgi:hypothetical protein